MTLDNKRNCFYELFSFAAQKGMIYMKKRYMDKQNWKSPVIRFMTAQTITLLGSSLVQYAIIWHITLLTSSGIMLTVSTVCGFLPQVIISLFAGVWIDRYDRKKMIMLSDAAIAVSTFVLAVLFFAGCKSSWSLFIILAIRSAGTGIQTPAVNAVIPQLVPREQLMRVNGINSTLSSMIMFLSPALSGAVLSMASLEAAMFIDVITAFIGVGITASVYIKPYERLDRGPDSYIEQIKGGFACLRENGFVRRLLIYQIAVLFLISPSAFLTPLMVSRTFGTEVWRLTASEMTYSLGMVLGGLLIASWGGFRNKMYTVMSAGAAYGILMTALGNAPEFLMYLGCNTMIGITSPCYNAPVTVLVQEKVPQDMHGRIFSFMQIASSCALPLGMLLFGPLADIMEVGHILTAAGGCVILASLGVWKCRCFL